MQLSSLIADLDGVRVIGAVDGIEITQVTMDSREVIPGALFCCVPGTISDGHRFLGEAVNAGALAVVTEHDHDGELSGCVELRVATGIARRTASLLAGIFEGLGRTEKRPSRRWWVRSWRVREEQSRSWAP